MTDAGGTVADLFGGGRTPRDTRERLLFKALDLFQAYGFHAVGLDRVLTEVGVTKTTFYNHFASKDDLMVAAVALRDAWEQEAFRKALTAKAGYDPRALLLGVFDVLDEWFTDPKYAGCLFINAAAEFPAPHDPVHRAAAKHYAVTAEDIARMAEAAGADDPEALSREWIILIQGAITHRLVDGDDAAARQARAVAEGILERRLA